MDNPKFNNIIIIIIINNNNSILSLRLQYSILQKTRQTVPTDGEGGGQIWEIGFIAAKEKRGRDEFHP